MFGPPPVQVWKGLAASTTSAWFFLHLVLAVAPRLEPRMGSVLVSLPTSAFVVLCAAAVTFLDLFTYRERILYENLGIGRLTVYAAALAWVGLLELALGVVATVMGLEVGT